MFGSSRRGLAGSHGASKQMLLRANLQRERERREEQKKQINALLLIQRYYRSNQRQIAQKQALEHHIQRQLHQQLDADQLKRLIVDFNWIFFPSSSSSMHARPSSWINHLLEEDSTFWSQTCIKSQVSEVSQKPDSSECYAGLTGSYLASKLSSSPDLSTITSRPFPAPSHFSLSPHSLLALHSASHQHIHFVRRTVSLDLLIDLLQQVVRVNHKRSGITYRKFAAICIDQLQKHHDVFFLSCVLTFLEQLCNEDDDRIGSPFALLYRTRLIRHLYTCLERHRHLAGCTLSDLPKNKNWIAVVPGFKESHEYQAIQRFLNRVLHRIGCMDELTEPLSVPVKLLLSDPCFFSLILHYFPDLMDLFVSTLGKRLTENVTPVLRHHILRQFHLRYLAEYQARTHSGKECADRAHDICLLMAPSVYPQLKCTDSTPWIQSTARSIYLTGLPEIIEAMIQVYPDLLQSRILRNSAQDISVVYHLMTALVVVESLLEKIGIEADESPVPNLKDQVFLCRRLLSSPGCLRFFLEPSILSIQFTKIVKDRDSLVHLCRFYFPPLKQPNILSTEAQIFLEAEFLRNTCHAATYENLLVLQPIQENADATACYKDDPGEDDMEDSIDDSLLGLFTKPSLSDRNYATLRMTPYVVDHVARNASVIDALVSWLKEVTQTVPRFNEQECMRILDKHVSSAHPDCTQFVYAMTVLSILLEYQFRPSFDPQLRAAMWPVDKGNPGSTRNDHFNLLDVIYFLVHILVVFSEVKGL